MKTLLLTLTERNIDVPAFYLCYYRFCTPEEVTETIEQIWEDHKTTQWSAEYNVAPETRLVLFVAASSF